MSSWAASAGLSPTWCSAASEYRSASLSMLACASGMRARSRSESRLTPSSTAGVWRTTATASSSTDDFSSRRPMAHSQICTMRAFRVRSSSGVSGMSSTLSWFSWNASPMYLRTLTRVSLRSCVALEPSSASANDSSSFMSRMRSSASTSATPAFIARSLS
ncbi:hypothetical protein ACFPRL_26790 [Pseudoclavibacter helvolus]